MAEMKVAKCDVALEYLDAAIEFFLAGRNLFCAIHLSAAAEELLGALLLEGQRVSTLAWKAEKALISETGQTLSDREAMKSVNEWKNEVKHMNGGSPRTLIIDPAFAAEYHIGQALNNFYKLGLPKSIAVWNFEDIQNRRIRDSQ